LVWKWFKLLRNLPVEQLRISIGDSCEDITQKPKEETPLGIHELIIPLFFLFWFWLIARLIRRRMPEGSAERKYFVWGLMFKLLGAVGVGAIYKFYYGFGDTLNYFFAAQILHDVFWENPITYFQCLFADAEGIAALIPEKMEIKGMWYLTIDSALPVVKICSIFLFITFQSYFATALCYAVLAYSGLWALFKVFIAEYPSMQKEMALAVLFIPSVFFWGSGILKDGISLAAVGWITYASYQLFVQKKQFLFSIFNLWFWGGVLFTVKAYILMALAGPILLWLFLRIRRGIENPIRRFASGPLLLVIGGLLVVSLFDRIGQELQTFALDNIVEQALASSRWNARGYTSASFSAYEIDMESIDFTNPVSLLSLFPQMVILTLYRPFLWEANKVIILFAALENAVFLFLSLRLFFKRPFLRIFRTLFSDPNLIFFLCFILVFAFAIGLSSGVFGALVRYKIPCLPFFAASLFILYEKSRKERG
jgi:hypothetical protein